jgi:hypothetical protein
VPESSHGPYRTHVVAAPRRISRPIDTTPLSSLPLGIIAITLFLPVTHDCNNQLESPLDSASQSVGTFLVIAPLFIAAAALCAAIAYTYWKRLSSSWVVTAIVGLHVVSSSVLAVLTLVDDKKGAPWLLASLPSLVIFTIAWWRRGLRRLSSLVDAYVVASLPLAGLIVMVADVYGGYVFGFAFALLILFRVAQLVSRLISR